MSASMVPISTMNLLCVTHAPFEGPAAIAGWAQTRGHSFRVVSGNLGDTLPPAGSVEGVVVMGGPMRANDDAAFPWLSLLDHFFLRRYIA